MCVYYSIVELVENFGWDIPVNVYFIFAPLYGLPTVCVVRDQTAMRTPRPLSSPTTLVPSRYLSPSLVPNCRVYPPGTLV